MFAPSAAHAGEDELLQNRYPRRSLSAGCAEATFDDRGVGGHRHDPPRVGHHAYEWRIPGAIGPSGAPRLSQARVALEVGGVVEVRHGDGTVVTPGHQKSTRIVEAIRSHADRLPEIIETRDALETKIASLAAARRTEDDLARIDDALAFMAADIEAGGRGVEGDERFHGAVTAASHSLLLARLMDEIGDLIRETRIESLSQPDRPRNSLAGHRAVAEAIRAGDAAAAAAAMHEHVEMVSDVALLRDAKHA
jgi:GntR family transcriptional repressor for pyruvate dehydrogenase complex